MADAYPLWPPWVWLAASAVAAAARWKWKSRAYLLLLSASVFAFAHHAQDRDPLRETLAAQVREGGAAPAAVTGIITDAPAPDSTGTGVTFPLKIERLETPVDDAGAK